MSELIISSQGGKDVSKLQKQFNNYVKKINQYKSKIEIVEAQIEVATRRIHSDLAPLERKMVDAQVEMILKFDKHYESGVFKKKEKEKLSTLINAQCGSVLSQIEIEVLLPIFEKHNQGKTFEEADAEVNKQTAEKMKNMMGAMFNIDFDDDADIDSPEKMQAYIDQQMQEREAQTEARRASRKKSAAAQAREDKARQETLNISKAARAIYADLVKAFHPDREKDETEKVRKTEIMNRVTEAYSNNDLYELLRLKIEFQGADIDSLTMVDEQLKYYNKILKEQAQELESQYYEITGYGFGFGSSSSIYERFCGDKKTMDAKFARVIKEIKTNTKGIYKEIEKLDNPFYISTMLKEMSFDNRRRSSVDFFDML